MEQSLLALGLAIIRARASQSRHADPLIVQFAYPVTSIDPSVYDDWESVFIGNHIYRRMLPDEDKPWVPYLTQKLHVDCESQSDGTSQNCATVRITFKPELFTDCSGRRYTAADIRAEFYRLLRAKGWVLPKWKPCNETGDEICVRARNVPDMERRLRNVNFRFGWSRSSATDAIFGAGTYCLHAKADASSAITTGSLIPRIHDERFPRIDFHQSQKNSDYFHMALYGSKSLLAGKRRNVHAHTPLAYYVVTNPKLAGYKLPWNTPTTRDIINRHLVSYEVFFTETPQYMRLAPEGGALEGHPIKLPPDTMKLELVLPNFLPHCPALAKSLNESWGNASSARARCGDIIDYVVERVRARKGPWTAFLAGVSPSDPGRDAIRNQYFSPESSESWTYDYPKPEQLFYLVGMGQSLVTVDSLVVCDIRPNPLGLGDIYVTDLLPCK